MTTPSLEYIATEVRALIAHAIQRDPAEVQLEMRLVDGGLAFDSLALIKLNVALEERFDVCMPDFDGPEAARLSSVRDVVELVAGRIAARTEARAS